MDKPEISACEIIEKDINNILKVDNMQMVVNKTNILNESSNFPKANMVHPMTLNEEHKPQ